MYTDSSCPAACWLGLRPKNLFFLLAAAWVDPGGAPFSQLSSGVKDAVVLCTLLIEPPKNQGGRLQLPCSPHAGPVSTNFHFRLLTWSLPGHTVRIVLLPSTTMFFLPYPSSLFFSSSSIFCACAGAVFALSQLDSLHLWLWFTAIGSSKPSQAMAAAQFHRSVIKRPGARTVSEDTFNKWKGIC